MNSAEETLLLKKKGESQESPTPAIRWKVFAQELKWQTCIAGPMIVVNLSQFLLQVTTLMMVGRLGELKLSGTAIAFSLCTVTGFTLLTGMASALETLAGQAYGAKQYRKVRIQTYTAVFSQIIFSLPVALIWIFLEKMLISVGQDPRISHEAGTVARTLLPALFACATVQPLLRYLQVQSLTLPMLASSCVVLSLHIPLCWVLIFKSGLGNIGGALAMSISYWLNVIFISLYIKFSAACAITSAPITWELFQGIGEFFRYAIPSAMMMCIECWAFEVLILLSGLLPRPQLEASVLSICLHTQATLFSIPNGLGAAGSTRVSNELGAGNPEAARIAVYAVIFLGIAESLVISAALFASRDVFGYVFSNVKEVVEYVKTMSNFLCINIILDSLQGILSAVARGCGWQHLGAYINIAAYFFCGLPLAAVLGFWLHLNGMGLWVGVLIGAFMQDLMLSIVTSRIDYEKQGALARERVFKVGYSIDSGLA